MTTFSPPDLRRIIAEERAALSGGSDDLRRIIAEERAALRGATQTVDPDAVQPLSPDHAHEQDWRDPILEPGAVTFDTGNAMPAAQVPVQPGEPMQEYVPNEPGFVGNIVSGAKQAFIGNLPPGAQEFLGYQSDLPIQMQERPAEGYGGFVGEALGGVVPNLKEPGFGLPIPIVAAIKAVKAAAPLIKAVEAKAGPQVAQALRGMIAGGAGGAPAGALHEAGSNFEEWETDPVGKLGKVAAAAGTTGAAGIIGGGLVEGVRPSRSASGEPAPQTAEPVNAPDGPLPAIDQNRLPIATDHPQPVVESVVPVRGPEEVSPVAHAESVPPPTVPESAATIDAQMQSLRDGKRAAVLVTEGEAMPDKGAFAKLKTKAGTFIYDSKRIKPTEIKKAVAEDRIGDVLGMGVPRKPEPGTEVGAVVVRTPEGIEKQAVVTDEASLPAVTEAANRLADPGDTVALEDPARVIGERVGAIEPSKQDLIEKTPPQTKTGDLIFAIRTEDGKIHQDRSSNSHVEVSENLGVDPLDIESTGFVTKDGRYIERPEEHYLLEVMSVADLRAEASDRGLPTSGTKSDLVVALTEHRRAEGENLATTATPPPAPDATPEAKAPEAPPVQRGVPAKEVAPEPEPTSLRHAFTKEYRRELGMDEIDSPERQSLERVTREAIERKMPDDAVGLAASIVNKPRPITAHEDAGMTVKLAQLRKDRQSVAKELEGGDEATQADAAVRLNRIQDDIDVLTEAAIRGGTETGRALQARTLALKEDLSIATVKAQARIRKGEKLTAKESAEFEALGKQIEALDTRIAQVEKGLREQTADRAIRRHKGDTRHRAKATVDYKATVDEVRALIKAGCK